jgi:hypothetical protein
VSFLVKTNNNSSTSEKLCDGSSHNEGNISNDNYLSDSDEPKSLTSKKIEAKKKTWLQLMLRLQSS